MRLQSPGIILTLPPDKREEFIKDLDYIKQVVDPEYIAHSSEHMKIEFLKRKWFDFFFLSED